MGSKYFQSDTAGIYKRVLELLKRNERVLFCGTPCQVAALRAYLGREYENLYLLDFICKGINSPKAYIAYIEELEQKYKSTVKCVRQKSKKTGWQSLATNIIFENNKEYHKDRYTDWMDSRVYMWKSFYEIKIVKSVYINLCLDRQIFHLEIFGG